MAFLMIILLYAIIFQLNYGTKADLRVAENDVTITQMDSSIESALQEVYDRLKQDGATAAAEGGAGGAAAGAGAGMPSGGAGQGGQGAEGGGEDQPSDSRMDSWGRPQRSTIGDIELRILVQDEDGKINVLQLLAEDEEERDQANERLVRLIDFFRDGSTVDVDRSEAIRIVEAIKLHLTQRTQSVLPRPKLTSDDAEDKERCMPLTLKEFEVLERLDERLFRDFRDERGDIVHSLGSYLTVWSSITQGASEGEEGAGGATPEGQGGQQDQNQNQNQSGGGSGSSGDDPNWGVCVNVNTAPVAVLKALVDDREVSSRFWDAVIEYRNLEKKEEEGEESSGSAEDELANEPQLDENGEAIVEREFFDSLEELAEVDGWERLEETIRGKLQNLLCTRSHVFSIYVTARRKTGTNDEFGGYLGTPRQGEREDERGKGLVRTVRSVVWRYGSGEDVKMIPLVRWEVLDYTPFDVIDFPVEGR